MVASFFDQLLPVLDLEGAIPVELYTDGGDAEIDGAPPKKSDCCVNNTAGRSGSWARPLSPRQGWQHFPRKSDG
jgi:hypothetical protein